jgi:hypothetical protein
MSEIINLAKGNGDDHVYESAAKIMADKIGEDYSFVIQTWDQETPKTKHEKILILTSDESHQIPSQLKDKSVLHIFKQYCPMSEMRNPHSVMPIDRVTPIPLCHLEGVIDKNIPIHNRELDWCWLGQFNQYSRQDFKFYIDKLETSGKYRCKNYWYIGWNKGIEKDDYSRYLSNSKIVFTPVGSASIETFRFFEAMMCGCVVVSLEQPEIEIYQSAPYIKVNDWSYLEYLTDKILSDKVMISEISDSAKIWYKKYCSPEGLANYMIGALNV